jgi:hypothetical protein
LSSAKRGSPENSSSGFIVKRAPRVRSFLAAWQWSSARHRRARE